ncbi:hypothetical protein [Polymorphum gilvum]|uniref:Conserved hypothetical exported protein n=1 Tax=Polymorphum gilvum (strain LMG 25793 / CGMCC 1.9160 / SL003B-26A1) TaxID=991905 RepID=F2IW98_POLGS|nr:hypothetical protein [Polymorphum gilvum]ADZ71483.1 Conserved hypothetical exported protein [Polymorphum gilvum SL003B-26A1]
MNKSWLPCATLLLPVLLPVQVFAADATAPVREIMTAAEANWAETPGDYQDYFSEDRLARLYSADFVARYRKAAEVPFSKEMGTPFDYDVIVNGQDGCPLKDLSIAAGPTEGAATVVVARFQGLTCFGSEVEYQAYSETRFRVVTEAGRPVVDDILLSMDGETLSLKAEMDAIAAN